MKVIAVAQGKGGVGKTTITVGAGLYCARKSLRVLLIDGDKQANLTASFMPLEVAQTAGNAYDLMKGETVEPVNVRPNIDLVPSSLQLVAIETENDIDVYYRFREAIRAQYVDRYDVVIVDTPGNLESKAVYAALNAADVVFSPSQANDYSNTALYDFYVLFRKVRQRWNPDLQFAGVVMNAVKGILANGSAAQTTEREAISKYLELLPDKLLGLVGQRAVIRDSFSEGKWLTNDESGQQAAAELTKVFDKILATAGLQ